MVFVKYSLTILLAFIAMAFCAASVVLQGKTAVTVYTVTDFYNTNGGLSDLGLALEEQDSEKTLKVKYGDVLIVGKRQYKVTADSLTLFFYSLPSHEMVIEFWNDYMNSWEGIETVKC